MKCPHCLSEFHDTPSTVNLGNDTEGAWALLTRKCPACNKAIFELWCCHQVTGSGKGVHIAAPKYHYLARPKTAGRPAPPAEVPNDFAEDYKEACLVIADSPKASAALSRRCLQHLLREKGGVKPGNLANEIQQVLDSGKLPTYISEAIDAVRNIGNFAAHPLKDESSGEVLPVEPGEAEWNLDVLEALFDFYFVQPELLRKKRENLNKKLQDIGKPEMK